MSRIVDLLLVIVGLFAILTAQFAAGAVLGPLEEDLGPSSNDYDGAFKDAAQEMSGDVTALTKWVPTIAGGGLFLVAAVREYRRQRVSAVKRRAGP